MAFNRRLMKEREELSTKPPAGINLQEAATGDSLNRWVVKIDGADGTLYAGESFKLQFIFSSKYPFDSPQAFESYSQPSKVFPSERLQTVVYCKPYSSLHDNTLESILQSKVTFIGDSIPVHPHIYSNGHICLSILDEDWSPALSVSSICISIVSMLSSCTKKERPSDNSIYVSFGSKNPKKTKWLFHDDKV